MSEAHDYLGPVPPPARPWMLAAPESAPASQAQTTAVHVSADILAACRIDDSPTGKAPLFAFDSAALSHSDQQRLLGEVAQCLTGSPLAGRALKLVGRAALRGIEAYNVRLGDERASGVESYLERHGMVAAKLSETSRGALSTPPATTRAGGGWTGASTSTWRCETRRAHQPAKRGALQ